MRRNGGNNTAHGARAHGMWGEGTAVFTPLVVFTAPFGCLVDQACAKRGGGAAGIVVKRSADYIICLSETNRRIRA